MRSDTRTTRRFDASSVRFTASLALLLAAGTPALAGGVAPWARAFGSAGGVDETTAVGVDGDEIVFAGTTRSNGSGNADAWVARTDSSGNVLWEIAIGGASEELVNALLVTDAGTLLAGSTRSFGEGGRDAWLVLVDDLGNVVWQKTYGDRDEDNFVSLAPSPDGFYLLGNIVPNSTGLSDAWVMEVNATGDVLWQKRLLGAGNDTARCVAATPAGLVATVDAQSDFGNGGAAFFRPLVVRMDGDGVVTGARTYSVSDGDSFAQIIPLADGSLIGVGEVFSTAFFQGEGWLVKFDDEDTVVFDKRVGNHFNILDFDFFSQGFVNADGSITVLGGTGTGGNGFGALWFARFDASGNLIGDTTYGGPGFDLGLAAAPFGADGVVLGGRIQLSPPEVDAIAMLVSADGSLAEDCMVEGPTDPRTFEPDGLPIVSLDAPILVESATAVLATSSAGVVTTLASGFPLCGVGPGVCAGDCDMNGVVDFNDLVSMLFEFGETGSPAECDTDETGRVDFNDLVAALFLFGPCDGGPGPLPE